MSEEEKIEELEKETPSAEQEAEIEQDVRDGKLAQTVAKRKT